MSQPTVWLRQESASADQQRGFTLFEHTVKVQTVLDIFNASVVEVQRADNLGFVSLDANPSTGYSVATFEAEEVYIVRITPRPGPEGCTFDELVQQPLPTPYWSGLSVSESDREKDHNTHPTTVQSLEQYKQRVKARLQQGDVQGFRSNGPYKLIAFDAASDCYILGEDAAVAELVKTACERINTVFNRNGVLYRYALQPCKRPTDSTLAERAARPPSVEVDAIEARLKCSPDICLVGTIGPVRPVRTAAECADLYRLRNVKDLVAVWHAKVYGQELPADVSPAAAHNAVQLIAQELGYMSRRGLLHGWVSTHELTWIMETDGKGNVWLSDSIPHSARGDAEQVSVTEALLYVALVNLDQKDFKHYPTAKEPGGAPIAMVEFEQQRKEAADAVADREEAEVSSGSGRIATRSGSQYDVQLPAGALHLMNRLSRDVFLGSVNGKVAAVRLAVSAAVQQRAEQEVAAYKRLQDLQGVCVPRLLAYGKTLDGAAYFVATQYVQGETWDWWRRAHRALDAQLLAALAAIHDAGVLHGDLHEGNVLVTPGGQVFVVDFDAAELAAPIAELTAEQKRLSELLSTKVVMVR